MFLELPDRLRRDFEASLSFAAGTVGAEMSTAVVTAAAEDTVAGALKRIKEDRNGESDVVCVIDHKRHLLGTVRLSVLARCSSRSRLADLIESDCTPVSARAPLSEITSMPAWQRYCQLPVVSRRGELLGTIQTLPLSNSPRTINSVPGNEVPSVASSVVAMFAATAPKIVSIVAPTANAPLEVSHER